MCPPVALLAIGAGTAVAGSKLLKKKPKAAGTPDPDGGGPAPIGPPPPAKRAVLGSRTDPLATIQRGSDIFQQILQRSGLGIGSPSFIGTAGRGDFRFGASNLRIEREGPVIERPRLDILGRTLSV